MAEEHPPQPTATPPDGLGSIPEERARLETPAAESEPEEQPESSTKGMLRDAIQKVMSQIEYHEREAKRHLQLAEELRKDLRESFAFLLTQETEAAPAESTEETHAEKAESAPPPAAKPPAAEKHPRAGKKRPGRKSKGG